MGSMEQQQSLIERNIKTRSRDDRIEAHLTKLEHQLDDAMKLIIELVSDIKQQGSTNIVYKTVVNDDAHTTSFDANRASKPFIPSSNSSDLNTNISDINKKTKETDMSYKLKQLSNLNKN